jgi:hypothetical protein|tara:strand:+ start:22275 stop:22571 length:297 start_codon:yes stop_codon:yes gene_type:complete
MITQEFIKTEDLVYKILKEDKFARDSEKWLTIKVLKAMGVTIGLGAVPLSSIPSFETIYRCRRKIQNQFREFRPTEAVEDFRGSRSQYVKVWSNGSGE